MAACSLAVFPLALLGAMRKAGAALAASRWLLETGDTEAARLLSWNEAWGETSGSVGGDVFASLVYLERARIEDSRGNTPLAQEYHQEFLLRCHMPTPKQPHLVDEAREALGRLSGRPDLPAEPEG
jgi:hypothetical protein